MAVVEMPLRQKQNVRTGKHREDNLALKDGFRNNAKPAKEGTPPESDKNEALAQKREFRAKQPVKKLKEAFKNDQDSRVGF